MSVIEADATLYYEIPAELQGLDPAIQPTPAGTSRSNPFDAWLEEFVRRTSDNVENWLAARAEYQRRREELQTRVIDGDAERDPVQALSMRIAAEEKAATVLAFLRTSAPSEEDEVASRRRKQLVQHVEQQARLLAGNFDLSLLTEGTSPDEVILSMSFLGVEHARAEVAREFAKVADRYDSVDDAVHNALTRVVRSSLDRWDRYQEQAIVRQKRGEDVAELEGVNAFLALLRDQQAALRKDDWSSVAEAQGELRRWVLARLWPASTPVPPGATVLDLARSLLETGDAAGALETIDRAPGDGAKEPAALNVKAFALRALGRAPESFASFLDALEACLRRRRGGLEGPDLDREELLARYGLLREGTALELARKVIQRESAPLQAWWVLAADCLARGDRMGAAEFGRAVLSSDQTPLGRLSGASILLVSGHEEEGIAIIEETLTQGSFAPHLVREVLHPLMQVGLLEKARRALELLSPEVRSSPPFALLEASLLELEGTLDGAKALLERMCADAAIRPLALADLGALVEQREGNLDRALSLFQEADEAWRGFCPLVSPEAARGRARCLARMGRLREAEALGQEVVRDWPEISNAWSDLSATQNLLGRWWDSLESARKALRWDRLSAVAWVNLASAFSGMGSHDEALRELGEGLALVPGSPDMLNAKFEIEVALGRLASARRTLEECRKHGLDELAEALESNLTARRR